MNNSKKLFDSYLSDAFLKCANIPGSAKILKKAIKYKSNKTGYADGEIDIEFYQKTKGYIIGIRFESEAFSSFINEISPPYNSNILTNYHFIADSGRFKNRRIFGNINGRLDLPSSESEMKTALDVFISDMNNFLIPKANNFHSMDKSLIKDIVEYDYLYSHPLLLIVFAAKINKLKFKDINNTDIFNKRLSKNINFDKSIAEKILI